MTMRFRMVAGPNGSGKSTLVAWLARDYAVNFYTMLNADDVFAQVGRSHAFFTPFPISGEDLVAYAIPHLSRAFFFDTSAAEMKYLACFSDESALETHLPENELPTWFKTFRKTISHS